MKYLISVYFSPDNSEQFLAEDYDILGSIQEGFDDLRLLNEDGSIIGNFKLSKINGFYVEEVTK